MKENNCSFTILSFYKVLYITSVVHMPSEITVVFCHIRVGTASVAYINQPISNKLVRKGLLFAVSKKVRQDVAAVVSIDDSDQPVYLSVWAMPQAKNSARIRGYIDQLDCPEKIANILEDARKLNNVRLVPFLP